jgi:hypothetical protein
MRLRAASRQAVLGLLPPPDALPGSPLRGPAQIADFEDMVERAEARTTAGGHGVRRRPLRAAAGRPDDAEDAAALGRLPPRLLKVA